MTAHSLIAFNIALLAAIISPGPAFVTAVQTTLAAGRWAGVSIGCGLGLVAAGWTLAALLGFEVTFTAFPWAYTTGRIAGAAYLLYVAYKMWRGARDPIARAQKSRARRAFVRGMLVNLLNPKSVLFAAAVLIVVFPSEMTASQSALVVANHLVVELLFYTAIAFGLSSQAVSARYLRAKVALDRFASLVLGALGLRLLFNR